MNDNLKNYSEQPDAEVWQQISKKMHKGRARRQMAGAAAGVVLVAAATMLMLRPANPASESSKSAAAPMAMLTRPAQPAAADQSAQPVCESMPSHPQAADVHPQSAEAAPAVLPVLDEPLFAESTPAVSVSVAAACPAADPAASPVARTVVQEPVVQAVAQPEESQKAADQRSVAAAKSGASGKVQDTILWVPNVFHPGVDDEDINIFRARLNKPDGYVSNFKMTIFNRSGHQVFHANDIATGWDGTYKGQALPQAAYVYIIYYTDKDRIQHQRKGTVTLVR